MTQSRVKHSTEPSQRTPRGRSNNVATVALLASLALILSYVEAIIPYTPGIPGIKLGIANLVAVVALYKLSAKYAVMLNVIRIVVAGLLFTGVSMAGGFLHNMGQLAIAALLINDIRIFYYLPVLMISGTIAGVAIGVAAELVIRRAKFIR